MKHKVSEIINTLDEILRELLQELKGQENIDVNERYIHHYFSCRLQHTRYPIKFNEPCELHPEWATARLGTLRNAKYSKKNKAYKIDDSGSSGFIDLAIGSVEKPFVGIEFKTSKSYYPEGVIYDYMKLLDKNVNIDSAVAIDIYYGRKSKLTSEELNDNIQEAQSRLGERYEKARDRYLWVIQICGRELTVFKCSGKSESFSEVQI